MSWRDYFNPVSEKRRGFVFSKTIKFHEIHAQYDNNRKEEMVMKKIMGIVVLIFIAFICPGTGYADEGSIDQLLTAYETANNEKNLTKLQSCIYKTYLQIYSDKTKIQTWSPSDGDKLWKDTERWFRILKSYKMTNRQITIDQNTAYVRCEETQSYKNAKTEEMKTMITLVKEKGRWYIAFILQQLQ
jgi:hypothetical protein